MIKDISPPKHIKDPLSSLFNHWLSDEAVCKNMPDDVREYFKNTTQQQEIQSKIANHL